MKARSPVPAATDDVPSPCVSICVLDARGRVCTGCLRTLDEIAGWVSFTPDEKRAIVAALPARRVAGTAP
jgi:predicted Fe-S protein YdhL (DUF1289 family)